MADLKKVCDSPLNIKIISFFLQHPTTVDTARGIGTWINQDQNEVAKALDYLASQNILVVHRTRSTMAYAFTQNKQMIKRMEKILAGKT